jgi:hypothetical protein
MGIGGKCKDNKNMADFEEDVALYVCILGTLLLRNRQTSSNKMSKFNWTNELVNDLMIYGRTFSRSILNVSLLILIFLYSSI